VLKAAYVIGLPETGGCWICTERCYFNHKQAYAALEIIRKHDPDCKDKVFHLYGEENDNGNDGYYLL